MSTDDLSQEQHILRMIKKTLIDVIKDTTTAPELKHPLSDNTIIEIKHALDLITTREQELNQKSGDKQKSRPYYIDEPQDSVQVSMPTRPKQPRRKEPKT